MNEHVIPPCVIPRTRLLQPTGALYFDYQENINHATHFSIWHKMRKLSFDFILDQSGIQVDADEVSNIDEEEEKTSTKPSQHHCRHPGCTHWLVSRGACIRHGGGPRCVVPNCLSGAKTGGRCWKHGGSRHCTVADCPNLSKARGLCWAHGGGKPCKMEHCAKTALLRGLCWAHGGGKRCTVEGCKRPAYERNGNPCDRHAQ
ncbi:hypothetical protein Ae201684_009777 [Aphanomyces euteiches]|uniref:WRKY19-like zinc finger domain-containing protein n=1 Tax=Aphanomyces euteiches TaxID=100861 RepID=A0A6G0X160_9STRA|nr:hypothetical protein Ae201684_009777 [Aphanomyces euteiches]